MYDMSRKTPKKNNQSPEEVKGAANASNINTHIGVLLLSLHLRNRIHVVLVVNFTLAPTEGNHTRLHADGLELRTTELIRTPRQLGPVDAIVDGHLARVDLQNVAAGLLVGQRELNLAVETAGAEEGRVQDVDAVCGGEDLDAVVGGEAVELVEKFEHGALDFTVAGFFRVESFRTNGIEFVDEDDCRALVFGERERVPDHFRTVTDEHLDQLGTGELEESGVCFGGTSTGEEGLTRSRRAVHQSTC